MGKIRVYHFLSAENALDDIEKRRIKISEIEHLNDPFELWCLAQQNRELRDRLRDYKQTMNKQYGVLCFCKGWRNPLLWSHYADRHRGMCLGFDVEDNAAKPVQYVEDRPSIPYPFSGELRPISDQLLSTKYIDWKYEDELRIWIGLKERDPATQLYFCDFEENLRLKEVIAGPSCEVTLQRIHQALGDMRDVAIIKARLAFKTFQVVARGWHFDADDT